MPILLHVSPCHARANEDLRREIEKINHLARLNQPGTNLCSLLISKGRSGEYGALARRRSAGEVPQQSRVSSSVHLWLSIKTVLGIHHQLILSRDSRTHHEHSLPTSPVLNGTPPCPTVSPHGTMLEDRARTNYHHGAHLSRRSGFVAEFVERPLPTISTPRDLIAFNILEY